MGLDGRQRTLCAGLGQVAIKANIRSLAGVQIYADVKELGEPGMLTFPPQKMFKEAPPEELLSRYAYGWVVPSGDSADQTE